MLGELGAYVGVCWGSRWVCMLREVGGCVEEISCVLGRWVGILGR